MDSEEEYAAALAVTILFNRKKKKAKKRKKREAWVKPWLCRRNKLGFYNTLLSELRNEEVTEYTKFLRMPPCLFDELLELIKLDIQKQSTKFREPVPAKIKLATSI